ncbi:MAG: SEC-C domain-containing protein, partial [Clostridia bacterium]|nr:SEC-C domain-containing protein [Clostridia bacterium]
LDGEDVSETIRNMMRLSFEENVTAFTSSEGADTWNVEALEAQYAGVLLEKGDLSLEKIAKWKPEQLVEFLVERADARYEAQKALFGEEVFAEVQRSVLLRSVDRHWMEHLDVMDDLKGSIGLQSYAQRNPITEYRLQGADIFDEMVADIRAETVRIILCAVPRTQPIKREQVAKPLSENLSDGSVSKKTVVVRKADRVGRNDLCPCGSGKKYKKCCGASAGSN